MKLKINLENLATGEWVTQFAIYQGEDNELVESIRDEKIPQYPGPTADQLMKVHGLQKGPIIGKIVSLLSPCF